MILQKGFLTTVTALHLVFPSTVVISVDSDIVVLMLHWLLCRSCCCFGPILGTECFENLVCRLIKIDFSRLPCMENTYMIVSQPPPLWRLSGLPQPTGRFAMIKRTYQIITMGTTCIFLIKLNTASHELFIHISIRSWESFAIFQTDLLFEFIPPKGEVYLQ